MTQDAWLRAVRRLTVAAAGMHVALALVLAHRYLGWASTIAIVGIGAAVTAAMTLEEDTTVTDEPAPQSELEEGLSRREIARMARRRG